MGLLLKLNNGDSQLKSLKFGNDRPGGGDSGQPYIKKGIQTGIQNPSFYNDFVVRGGIEAPLSAAEDVARLAKYFINIKNPSGLLFTAKQNLLSRVGIKTEASKGLGYAGGALNEGIYTPLSTLAEAGVVWAGGHINKQGLDPTGLFSFASINKYQDIISQNQLTGRIDLENNRLVRLSTLIPSNDGENNFAFVKGYSLNPTLENDVLISYGGGPDSVLGIGKTKIKFATGNDGVPLKTLVPKPKDYLVGAPSRLNNQDKFQYPTGSSSTYDEYIKNFSSNFAVNNLTKNGLNSYQYEFPQYIKVYNSGSLTNTDAIGKGSWTQQNFANQPFNTDSTISEDFRQILNPTENPQYTFLSLSPSYKRYMIEADAASTSAGAPGYGRIGLRSPGQKGNISDYIQGKRDSAGNRLGPVDFINALPIYKSSAVTSKNEYKNDLIKFRIDILDNDANTRFFMHFRAFLDSFTDSYGGSWKNLSYMGRGEDFYKYDKFSRDINVSFTVAALSKQELIPMYKKLNYLASSLAPDYSSKGYLRGNIAYLTVGAWCYELPGIINSIEYSVPEEAPWEIAIPIKDENGKGVGTQFDDDTVREMPHMIKVTMKFTPIHTFRPEIMSIKTNKDINKTDNPLNDSNDYGNQRYISLETSYNLIKQKPEDKKAEKISSNVPLQPLSNTNTLNLAPSSLYTPLNEGENRTGEINNDFSLLI
jgi:hypothetical protein